MEEGLSSSDVLALTRNNDGFGEGFTGIFGLLILLGIMGGGFGGWNNNRGYQPQFATQQDVQLQTMFQSLIDGNRDIITQANNNTNNIIGAVNASEYETISSVKDGQLAIQRDLSGLQVGQADMLARFNDAIGNTRLEIQGTSAGINQNLMQNRYESALNTAAINDNTTAQTQKILDALSANRIADMQNQINQLQLQAQMANVVRFPNGYAYNAGNFPPFTGMPVPPPVAV